MKNLIELKTVSITEVIIPFLTISKNKSPNIIQTQIFYIELWNDPHQTTPNITFILSKN
jgi:hypothetical protein